MRRLLILLLFMFVLAVPVSAMEFTAPEAPDEVQDLIPAQQESFAGDLWKIVRSALSRFQPKIVDACGVSLSLIAVVLLISLLHQFSKGNSRLLQMLAALAIGSLLLQNADQMIRTAADTVRQISEYEKLLLPVMTGAMAAQGGLTTSTALYAGTAVLDAVLSAAIAGLLVPMTYIFLLLAVGNSATGEDMLAKLRDFVKWLMSWILKIILYIFTGYLGITGVVSGTADAAALKATKLTISGMVPVVGSILSDASEAVILGAGVMKSAVGVYGLLTMIAIWITPFLQIGIQYLILKATASICAVFGVKSASALIRDFSAAMGLLLAMTGTVCMLMLISTVCFMKGVS